jgi:hypothetical protein
VIPFANLEVGRRPCAERTLPFISDRFTER